MSNGLIFGDRTGNTTSNDLDLTHNVEDSDGSDDDYSIKRDFGNTSLPDTIVAITIMNQRTSYQTTIMMELHLMTIQFMSKIMRKMKMIIAMIKTTQTLTAQR